MALTTKKVAKAAASGRYGDGNGLYLQVGPSGTKSWLFRYERDDKERWMGLGALHTVTLVEARERARRARLLLLDGLDPLEARAAEKATRALAKAKALTFEDAARQYYAAHEASWSSRKHRQQFRSTMTTYAYPKIGALSVAAIDTGQVLRCLEPIWSDKSATASRVRGRIENVLDWATVRGYRTGDNPARWKGHLSEVLPAPGKVAKPEHHAALPYSEVPEFMVKLSTREGIAARALEFTILTAARTGETIGARWDEIDLKTKTWTIPASRMKAGKEHKSPLSDRAVEILEALPREAEFVFAGSQASDAISRIAMYRVLRKLRSDIDVHGFRSSFSDWAHESTGHSNHAIELSLAHAVGNAVERAYRRGDLFEKRRKLMDAWAKFATSTPMGTADNVTPLRGTVR